MTRSFCYVDDLIDGFVRLMGSPAELVGPVNLSNPDEFTIKQLTELVIEMTGSRSKLAHMELPTDDPRQRKPEIALAGARLDWSPNVRLASGLEQTIAYFDKVLAGQSTGSMVPGRTGKMRTTAGGRAAKLIGPRQIQRRGARQARDQQQRFAFAGVSGSVAILHRSEPNCVRCTAFVLWHLNCRDLCASTEPVMSAGV